MLMVLVDGLGLAAPGPGNPLAGADTPALAVLAGQRLVLPVVSGDKLLALDAGLDMPGLPQSATGQTALFTGENAAALVGGHRSGFPSPRLRALLARRGLPARLVAGGRKVAFLNAFRSSALERIARGTYRPAVTTAAMLGAGVELRGVEELRAGRAVYHDLTGEGLVEAGEEGVELLDPAEAGTRVGLEAGGYDFALFEYFLTDRAGHRQDPGLARTYLERLDAFVGAAWAALLTGGPARLVLCSDHGNVEDLTVATHTVNPVPLLTVGHGRPPGCLRALTEVVPYILSLWGEMESDRA